MRILFVEAGVTAKKNFIYQCYPPLGLLCLASYLREQNSNHELKLFDLMIEKDVLKYFRLKFIKV